MVGTSIDFKQIAWLIAMVVNVLLNDVEKRGFLHLEVILS